MLFGNVFATKVIKNVFATKVINKKQDKIAREVCFVKKINDNGSAKRVTADAEELGRVIRGVQDESERPKSDILTWSQASQAIDALQAKDFCLADVLIISDFFFPLPIDKMHKRIETKHAKGTRYYGLQIGETKNPYDKVLDKIWRISV